MATKQEQVEAALDKPDPNRIDVTAPEGSPLPSTTREALVWLAQTGLVSEVDMPSIGRVVFRASAATGAPTKLDLTELFGAPKRKKDLVVGGYDPEVLFGHVDAPVPDDLPNEPLEADEDGDN